MFIKRSILIFSIYYLLFFCSAVRADLELKPFSIGENTLLKVDIINRLRGEGIDWFGEPLLKGRVIPKNYNYGLMSNRFQLGLVLNHDDWLESVFQFQNATLINAQADGVGVGASYYRNSPHTDQNSAFVRQGWLKLNKAGAYISGGRMLFYDGTQSGVRHNNLRWLMDNRLAQRLIGSLDYAPAGRSFDGGVIGYKSDAFELSGFGMTPTFGGLNINGMNGIDDLNLAGIALNLNETPLLGHTIGRLAWYTYNDDRPKVVVADNSPTPSKGAHLSINTIATHLAHVHPVGPGLWDTVLFGFGQFGDWQSQQHRAYAFGAEMGYQWPDVWGVPWLRAGINSGSGDNNPRDNTHSTFFQMIPSVPVYAWFPFYNMMNNRDVFAQVVVKPIPKLMMRMDFHALSVNARHDLMYSGSGASSNTQFGYQGLNTYGQSEIAYVSLIGASYKASDHVTINTFYGHAFGQGIMSRNFSDAQGNYGLLEVVVAF
jgi:hypothetical protein